MGICNEPRFNQDAWTEKSRFPQYLKIGEFHSPFFYP